jgi:rsbT co-antagonist protein RsbR
MSDRSARIARMEHVMARVADGDFDQRIELTGEDDELSNLELGINFMVMDLRTMMETNEEKERQLRQQAEDLEAQLARIQAQDAAIRELSTPAVEIWEGVLALPVIGVLDSKRIAEMQDNLLQAITRKEARYVVIDLTGVDVVDTRTADFLIKIVQAAELLGTQCVLTGLGPAVVQTLTELGADLGGITTLRNLKEGLRYCLKGLKTAAA